MLLALRALLDPSFDLSTADVAAGADAISIEATIADGRMISLEDRGGPAIAHFPAELRGGALLSPPPEGTPAAPVHSLIRAALGQAPAPRVALVRGLEKCADEVSGVVFAIEEPELYLTPQAHRYLRRLFQRLAERGNQIFFTTHAPGLLSVAGLDEVNLVSRDELGVTTVERLRAIDVDDAFRAMSEVDAERSELFLSRAAILVEGMTEKVTLPLIFRALGYDADREQISIVECGGKSNLPLFVQICKRARVPYVVLHDSDVYPDREPVESEVKLNDLIQRRAGPERTIVLDPDFESVVGYRSRRGKPERAWSKITRARPDDLPSPLLRAVRLALESAHPRPPSYS
jgi:hypothetical protein